MFSMFFFPVDKKLLISNNWNISSPGELLSSSYRELFFINEALNIFLIFLKFLREQIVKAITDRKKRGSKSQGKREIVSSLFTHWKRGLHRTTVCSPVLPDLRVTIHLRGWKGGRGSSNGVFARSKGLDWLAPGLSPDPIVSAHVVMGCARVTGEWGGDEVRGHRGNGERREIEEEL